MIEQFIYNPDDRTIFPGYYRRYEEIFYGNCSHWIDEKKVRLVSRKLSPADGNMIKNSCQIGNGPIINSKEDGGRMSMHCKYKTRYRKD